MWRKSLLLQINRNLHIYLIFHNENTFEIFKWSKTGGRKTANESNLKMPITLKRHTCSVFILIIFSHCVYSNSTNQCICKQQTISFSR